MNWTLWLKGLAAVAIGGAASGATAALGIGQLNKNTAITAGVGALSTVLAYLIRSPLAPPNASGTVQEQNGSALTPADASRGM